MGRGEAAWYRGWMIGLTLTIVVLVVLFIGAVS